MKRAETCSCSLCNKLYISIPSYSCVRQVYKLQSSAQEVSRLHILLKVRATYSRAMEWYLLFSQQLLEVIANLKKQLQGQTTVISDLQGNVDLLQGGMQVLNQEISTQNAEMQRLQTQTAHRLRWVQCQKAKNDSLCCQPTWSTLTDWKCTWRCYLHGLFNTGISSTDWAFW